MKAIQIFNTVTYLAVALAALTHAIMEILALYQVENVKKPFSFNGAESWKRKYKRHPASNNSIYMTYPAPDNFYYRYIAKAKYKEAFPGSSTIFVFVTDLYHLVQWFMIKAILVAIVIDYDGGEVKFNVWKFLALWLVWTTVFTLVFHRPRRNPE